jgi:hypothetical protein
VTPAEFKALLPEFAGAPDSLVQSRLTMAETRTPADVWGDLIDQGILHLAAELLCVLPQARPMAIADGAANPYKAERRRLEVIVSSGFRVTGRT